EEAVKANAIVVVLLPERLDGIRPARPMVGKRRLPADRDHASLPHLLLRRSGVSFKLDLVIRKKRDLLDRNSKLPRIRFAGLQRMASDLKPLQGPGRKRPGWKIDRDRPVVEVNAFPIDGMPIKAKGQAPFQVSVPRPDRGQPKGNL